MKSNDGYVLLKSLLTAAIVLICAASLYTALAMSLRQSGHLGSRLYGELLFRNDKMMERIK